MSREINDSCVLIEAIRVFGCTNQELKAMEECGELIQAISRHMQGDDNFENVLEEIADVSIMIDQLTIMAGIDRVEKIRNEKIVRLSETIKLKPDNANEVTK
jgi:NTP pyrophosphatase (non-canonical NTP hydrolase)